MRISTALVLIISLPAAAAAASQHWVATWGASPAPQLADDALMRSAKLTFHEQTLREIVHTSIGGDTVRVRLSNAYGKQTLAIGAVHIALRAKGGRIVPGSDRALTFGGRTAVMIAANAPAISDPVKLTIAPRSDLAISIYVPGEATGSGIHYSALQISYVGKGDQTAAESFQESDTTGSWIFLSGVDVLAAESVPAVVAFGDSITDGARSTVDTNRRWPDILADRLNARGRKIAVVDEGIGGNRILHDAAANVRFGVNALARFDGDVLAQPGVRYVIVLEGINDLGHAGTSAPESERVSAEDLIAGMKQMIERAHEHGIKIIGATLTPFDGAARGYFTPEKEAQRKALNQWIRTGGAFDGVIDFEKTVRDPANPDKMLPAFDSGDHLHPGDAGYKAMGEAIDLALFK